MTLLEIVKDILNDMDSDVVNSIDDTVESDQVAQIVKTCYYEMLGNRNWPHTRKLIQVDGLGDEDKPTYLRLPERLKELSFLRYEVQKVDSTKTELREIRYKEPDAFLRMVSARDSSSDSVQTVVDFGGSKILVFNNKAPEYWTSFDDVHIVADSFDTEVDSTLQRTKTQALAYIEPEWVHTDNAVPDLPTEAFSALLEEAKSTAFLTLKQMANQKAEQKAARQSRWLSRKAWQAHGGIQYPDYGRKKRR